MENRFLAHSPSGQVKNRVERSGEQVAGNQPPNLPQKAVRYGKAVKRWIAAGRPERSDEEVNEIYETLCQPCQHFNGKSCKICGCRIKRSGQALANKVRMATEHCPIKKW